MKKIFVLIVFSLMISLSSIVFAEYWNEIPLSKAQGIYLTYAQDKITLIKYMDEETIPNALPVQAVRIVGDRVLVGYQFGGANKWLFNVYNGNGTFEFGYYFIIEQGNLTNYTLSKDDFSILFFSGQNSVIYRLPADGSKYEIYVIPVSKMETTAARDYDSPYTLIEASAGKVVVQDEQGQSIIIVEQEIEDPTKNDWIMVVLFFPWFFGLLYFLPKFERAKKKS